MALFYSSRTPGNLFLRRGKRQHQAEKPSSMREGEHQVWTSKAHNCNHCRDSRSRPRERRPWVELYRLTRARRTSAFSSYRLETDIPLSAHEPKDAGPNDGLGSSCVQDNWSACWKTGRLHSKDCSSRFRLPPCSQSSSARASSSLRNCRRERLSWPPAPKGGVNCGSGARRTEILAKSGATLNCGRPDARYDSFPFRRMSNEFAAARVFFAADERLQPAPPSCSEIATAGSW
jgi:hypothetical protein